VVLRARRRVLAPAVLRRGRGAGGVRDVAQVERDEVPARGLQVVLGPDLLAGEELERVRVRLPGRVEVGARDPGRIDVQLHPAHGAGRAEDLTEGAHGQRRSADVDLGAGRGDPERRAVDEGLEGGDPKLRMAQAPEALLRDSRLIVGIKEHTQGMTVEQAADFFVQHALASHAVAMAEAVRGTADPLYGRYTWGKLMLFKLRSDYRQKMGARYTLARFHDELLAHGAPPIAALRRLLLGPGNAGALL